VASLKGKAIGVIFDVDTATDLDYLRRYHQHAIWSLEGGLLIGDIRRGYAESSQPERILAAVKDTLSSHLKQATFYKDRPSLDEGNPDIIVVVHTRHTLLTPRSSDVCADYMADFFDRDYRYLGRAEGHQAVSMPALWTHTQRTEQIISELGRQKAMQAQALAEFDSSLSRLLQ
jgi:hypothetical protein